MAERWVSYACAVCGYGDWGPEKPAKCTFCKNELHTTGAGYTLSLVSELPNEEG